MLPTDRVAPVSAQGGRNSSAQALAYAEMPKPTGFHPAQYRLLILGMMARGHGIDALCVVLSIARDALLDLIVELDLPTPGDQPFRKAGGKYAWRPDEYPVLMRGWVENWSAAAIAHRLGRSRGGIWSKARRLGLPGRDRRSLHWPDHVKEPTPPPGDEKECAGTGTGKYPAKWRVAGTETDLELTSQRGGSEVAWAENIEALVEIGLRAIAGQRPKKIAEDYGVSYRTITSQLHWLHTTNLRYPEVDHFDRSLAGQRMREDGWQIRYCAKDTRFPYFHKKGTRGRSSRSFPGSLPRGIVWPGVTGAEARANLHLCEIPAVRPDEGDSAARSSERLRCKTSVPR